MRVYLSPHYDDVCFSIGHLASRFPGDLVNLFTRSRYVAAERGLPAEDRARVDAISELRRREDERFADAVRLTRHDLGLWEPPLLGYGPFEQTNLDEEVAILSQRLMPTLLALLPDKGDPRETALCCSMGIGGHRNHRSTLLAIRHAYETLCHRCTVFLYEDLPYASVRQARQAGVRHANRLFEGTQLTPIAVPIDSDAGERKMQWIALYASQHAATPRRADFTPASRFAPSLHEIVWRLSPPG